MKLYFCLLIQLNLKLLEK
ncbi:hypothetical protein LINGRAHAP2_LOCUS2043 [Linum grandiflorum]